MLFGGNKKCALSCSLGSMQTAKVIPIFPLDFVDLTYSGYSEGPG